MAVNALICSICVATYPMSCKLQDVYRLSSSIFKKAPIEKVLSPKPGYIKSIASCEMPTTLQRFFNFAFKLFHRHKRYMQYHFPALFHFVPLISIPVVHPNLGSKYLPEMLPEFLSDTPSVHTAASDDKLDVYKRQQFKLCALFLLCKTARQEQQFHSFPAKIKS